MTSKQPLLLNEGNHLEDGQHSSTDKASPQVYEDGNYKVYCFRWLIISIFILSGVANATVLLSWAPITDKANTYWDGIGLTAINLLNVVFQITYLPGTLIALRLTGSLRALQISGGVLTTVGCLIRLIGGLLRHQGLGAAGSYSLVLLGTAMVGLAQPFYLNMPAKIASAWFGVRERDVATTLCSLANPLGSAVGSFIPAIFVTSSSISTGISTLLTVQFGFAAAALLLTFLLFKDHPKTPPSESARQMKERAVAADDAATSTVNRMFADVNKLFANASYVRLFIAFTVILGNLNALAALLNQLPGGYSNAEVGITGSVLIMGGFIGAFATGFVLDHSKAYRTVLKSSYVLAFVFSVFFLSNCRSNNFALFVSSAALLGFSTLPTIPSTIVSVVECSYPVPEDASVGFLYIGANTMAIVMTFAGQVLLTIPSSLPAPFFPFGLWMSGFLLVILLPILSFQGQYLRLVQDQ